MNILDDVVLELLGSVNNQSSERGLVGAFTGASILSAAFVLWLVFTPPHLLASLGSLAAVAGALVVGAAGLLLSLLHWARNESDRLFAGVCLFANAGAVVAVALGIMK